MKRLLVVMLGCMAPIAQAQGPGTCAGRPNCAEVPAFVALVPEFRLSNAAGSRMVTATVRFTNMLNHPLVLGYVAYSGVVLDDQGNRYRQDGGASVRGIGTINDGSVDAKFVLAPGEQADARFEFDLPSHDVILGTKYEMDMSVREIDIIAGGQRRLGREHVLHFAGFSDDGIAAATAAVPPAAPPSAQPPPALAPPPVNPCAKIARCYNAGPFAAHVVRVTQSEEPGYRDIRVVLRLTNMTTQPLMLGYAKGSGAMIDNAGHRYDTFPRVIGIGEVSQSDISTPFTLEPGEARNTVFELAGSATGDAELGTTLGYDLSFVQLERLPSKQIIRGREYAIHFNDLAASGMLVAASASGQCAVKERCDSTAVFTAEIARVTSSTNDAGYRNVRLTLHITNITSAPLILGYAERSGNVIDDRGIRFLPGSSGIAATGSGVAGIGIVSRESADPQLALKPGEARDATFDFYGHRSQDTKLGSALLFDLALTRLEILPSHQVRETGQYAIDFDGLKSSAADGAKEGVVNALKGFLKRPPR
jgi:hypothetical protein